MAEKEELYKYDIVYDFARWLAEKGKDSLKGTSNTYVGKFGLFVLDIDWLEGRQSPVPYWISSTSAEDIVDEFIVEKEKENATIRSS